MSHPIANALRRIGATLHGWRFVFYLGAGMAAFQLAIVGLDLALQPTNAKWLGSTAVNAADAAIYLDYLEQGRMGFGLINPHFDQPQTPRIDPFWSTAGLLTRVGLSPLWTYNGLRVFFAFILAWALYAAAKSTTHNEKDARLMSFLMVSGLGVGFLNAIIFRPEAGQLVSPDLDSEFAIAPMLLGGPHILLSMALQITAIRFIWTGVRGNDIGQASLGGLAAALLASFHPYFIPLIGLVCSMACLHPNVSVDFGKRLRSAAAALAPSLVPVAYYVWLMADPSFKHWSQSNVLPLQPVHVWAITLSPLILAAVWITCSRTRTRWSGPKRPDWAVAWIVAALICLLLPFPWARKYTQALLSMGVLLTQPAWLKFRDWTKTQTRMLRCMLAFACCFPFLFLLKQETAYLADQKWNGNFYQTDSVFKAWSLMKQDRSPALAMATDPGINIWTPTYSGHGVWIGHPHATPDYANRKKEFESWLAGNDAKSYNEFLNRRNVKYLLSYPAEKTDRADKLLDNTWARLVDGQGVGLWRKLDAPATD